jgi:hypothetical protein
MPSSRFLISSQTLGSAAATVTFSSIPATYTDLVLRISARVDSGSASSLDVQLNSDTSTNYSRTTIRGNGASTLSNRTTSASNISLLTTNQGSSTTADTFTNVEIYIPSYTISQNKPISISGTTEDNATTAYITGHAGLWRNTATISSIQLTDNNAFNFVSGSSFYLYGLRSS